METVTFRGEGGGIHTMRLPLPSGIADRLASGALQRVNPDGTPYTGVPSGPAADPPAPAGDGAESLAARRAAEEKARAAEEVELREAPAKPSPRGRKADWVEYAVHHYPDTITRSAAEELTRDELAERFG